MSADSPYTPPSAAPGPTVRPLSSRRPDLLGLSLGGAAWGLALACSLLHSCMCGHLAHEGWSPGAVVLDGAGLVLAAAAAATLLLSATCLRAGAAFCFLGLFARGAVAELGLAAGLVGLLGLTVSAIRGRGPALRWG